MKFDHARTSSPQDISQFCNKISANFETTDEGNDVSANQEFLIVLSPNQFMKFICIHMIIFK
jgi:hypothetical protein